MPFSLTAARDAIKSSIDPKTEKKLDVAFSQVCRYLVDFPEQHANKVNKPLLHDASGLKKLAAKYLKAFRRSAIPEKKPKPASKPDKLFSIVLQAPRFGYSAQNTERIIVEHKDAMTAENCVGSLLNKYLDFVLRENDWCWCAGFVKTVDFIKPIPDGTWEIVQVRNRDTTDNSSSGGYRTEKHIIVPWFRLVSATGADNWANLPEQMQGHELSEAAFEAFARKALGYPAPPTPEPSGGVQAN